MSKNVDIKYLYEIYKDEYREEEQMDFETFIEHIEGIIETQIREKEF